MFTQLCSTHSRLTHILKKMQQLQCCTFHGCEHLVLRCHGSILLDTAFYLPIVNECMFRVLAALLRISILAHRLVVAGRVMGHAVSRSIPHNLFLTHVQKLITRLFLTLTIKDKNRKTAPLNLILLQQEHKQS
jgi:hypothetical protein